MGAACPETDQALRSHPHRPTRTPERFFVTPPSEVHLSDPAVEAATGRAHQVSAPATKKATAKKASTTVEGGGHRATSRRERRGEEGAGQEGPGEEGGGQEGRRRRRRAPTADEGGRATRTYRELEPDAVELVVEDLELDEDGLVDGEAPPGRRGRGRGRRGRRQGGQEAHPGRRRRVHLRAGRGGQAGGRAQGGPGLHALGGRRRRRAGAAGDGGRCDRRPGQGLPEADRQGRPAERRAGGRARQADRGRPVRRRDAQRRRRARSRPRSSTTTTGSPRTAGGPRTTCSRPTCGWWCRWPSATPAAACCSWT